MSQRLTLFSDYTGENAISNYCGLILKLLYNENSRALEEFLVAALQDKADLRVGPEFYQQRKQGESIPDFAISQSSFSIIFETKLYDWYYTEQIKKHLDGMPDHGGVRILFLLSNFESENYAERFEKSMALAKSKGMILQPISFEEFVATLESVGSESSAVRPFLEDLKLYLDTNGYLPTWRYLLDVVNAGKTLDEIRNGAYICPDTGGPYSHRRAKYFGPYSNKTVSAIHEIIAVVTVERDQSTSTIRWNNSDISSQEIMDRAVTQIRLYENRIIENRSIPLQVFLLSPGIPTNFVKETRGGMLQSKKYFWDVAADCTDASALAEKLMNKTWGEFP